MRERLDHRIRRPCAGSIESFLRGIELGPAGKGETSSRLRFTDYFGVEPAWAKLLGAVLLLAPVPARVKEWAYAAFAITTLGSALIAHLSIGEGPRRRGAGRRAPGGLWGLSYFCGVASRARASAGPLEDEQRVANQDPKNPARMKASTGSPFDGGLC